MMRSVGWLYGLVVKHSDGSATQRISAGLFIHFRLSAVQLYKINRWWYQQDAAEHGAVQALCKSACQDRS